jgi:hypothetical protein
VPIEESFELEKVQFAISILQYEFRLAKSSAALRTAVVYNICKQVLFRDATKSLLKGR